jgi:signal transduction histidine kinase
MFKYYSNPLFKVVILYVLFFIVSITNSTAQSFFDIPNSLNRELGEMIQDDEGFTWFITNQGLCRYDGNDVKLLDYKELQLPPNTTPNHLFCYKQFIICSQAGKLFFFNRFTRESVTANLGSWVSKIHQNKKGEIIFFTYSGQLWLFSEKNGLRKWLNLAAIAGIKLPVEFRSYGIDANETIFFFLTNHKFGKFESNKIQWGDNPYFETKKSEAKIQLIRMFAITSRFVSILFDNGNVNTFHKNSLTLASKASKNAIAAILNINDEIVLVHNGEVPKKSIEQDSTFRLIDDLFKEQTKVSPTILVKPQENRVLISTNNGLIELSTLAGRNALEIQQKKIIDFFQNKSVRCIYRTDNELLVGTYAGLFSCTKDTIKLLDKVIVYTMHPYNKEYLIIGLEGASGLAKYHIASKKIIQMPNLWYKEKHFLVTTICNNNGQWICGSFNGLYTLFDSSASFGLKPINLFGFEVGTIRQISKIKNKLLVACQQGVFKISNNKLEKIYPKQSNVRVSAMLEASDGIWLATHGEGLVKINDTGKVVQTFGFNEGLLSNFVYSFAKSKNNLIVGTGSGVNNLQYANDLYALPLKKNTELNGNFSQEFNHSAFLYDTLNQQVFLGGVNGLAIVDVAKKAKAILIKSSIRLSYIKTNEKNAKYQLDIFAGVKDTIKVYSINSSVNLKFTSISSEENEMAFFRIKGLSNQWQKFKLKDELNFYALPPGNYTIEVKPPYSEDSREWFSKVFIVMPAFYQTIFFKIVVVLVVLFFIYLLWLNRTNKLKKEFKMRSLIASDLHDDIGSTLNSISVYAAIAEQQYETNANNTKKILDKMGVASREMIDRMSDIVWAIHPKNDAFHKVIDRIRFFAAELLSNKNIVLNFYSDEGLASIKLSMEIRKNVYLICKEAINNAYKYANASNFSLSFKKVNNKLIIQIIDDGIGFDISNINSNGNGVTNMKTRAKEINAVIEINSTPNKGTVIHCSIPI